MSTESLGWKKMIAPSSIVRSYDRPTTGRAVVRLQAAYRGQKTRDRVVRPALVAFRQIHEEISAGCHDKPTIEKLCGPMKLPSCVFGDQRATAGAAAAASVPGPGDLTRVDSFRKSSGGSRARAWANASANAAGKARRAGDVPRTEADIDHAGDAGKHTDPSTSLVTPLPVHTVGLVPPARTATPELAVVGIADGAAAAASGAVVAVAVAAASASAVNGGRGAVYTAEQKVNGEKSNEEEKEEREEEVEENMDHPRAATRENVVGIDGDATEHLPRGNTGYATEASTEDYVVEQLPGCRQQSPGSNGGKQQAHIDRRAPSLAERGARKQAECVSEKVTATKSTSTVEMGDEVPWTDESPTADCFTYSDGDGDGDDDFLGRIPAKNGSMDSALLVQNRDAPSDPNHPAPGTFEVETRSAAQYSHAHGGRVPAGRSQEVQPLALVKKGTRTATTRTRQDEDDRGASAASDDKKTASPDGDASAITDGARWTGAVEFELDCEGPASISGGDANRKVEHERRERCASFETGGRSAWRETATRDRRRGGREGNRQEDERNERQMEGDRDGRKTSADLLADAFAACSSPARDVLGPPGRKQGQNDMPGSSLTWSLASSFDASPLKGESIFASSLAVENDPPRLGVRDSGAGDKHPPADAKTVVSGEAASAVPASRGIIHRQESPLGNTASITEWSSLELEKELGRIREAVASRVLYLRSIMREPRPAAP